MAAMDRHVIRSAVALLAVAISGCGAVPSSTADIQLIVHNTTEAPVTFRFVEYDFEANEPGAEIAPAAPPLQAGESTEIGIVPPDVESWAYLVNDLVGAASFEIRDMARTMPGSGPLVFDISVSDDGLQSQKSRADADQGEAGVTGEPAGQP